MTLDAQLSDDSLASDEQPSDEAMERLSAALDATLDPITAAPVGPDRPGILQCKRCGHRWNPRPSNPHPRACAFCHSSYWDREPKHLSRAMTPDKVDWDAERAAAQQRSKDSWRRTKIRRTIAIAKELGLSVKEPPAPRPRPTERPRMTITPAAASPPTREASSPSQHHPRYSPTVPPPPGIEDLK